MKNFLSTDSLELVTSSAAPLDVLVDWMETAIPITPSSSYTPGVTPTAIVSAVTTTIMAAPASGVRNWKNTTVHNKHASLSNDVTLQRSRSGTKYIEGKTTLRAGETQEYIEGVGFFTVAGPSAPAANYNTADVVANGTDTYLTGSAIAIPTARPLAVGTKFEWELFGTKTAAGLAAPVWNVRFGTAGALVDTARVTFTQVAAQTAVVDAGHWKIKAIVRGPIGVSGIVAGGIAMEHVLAATGFSTVAHNVQPVNSAGFDLTTEGLIVGLSVNPGAAGVWTFQLVSAEVTNL